MSALGDPVVVFSSFLVLVLLSILLKIFFKQWWAPTSLQYMMISQGIKGPPYRFFHGNTKEILSMRTEAMASPMSLSSHDLLSKVQPHIKLWIDKHGMVQSIKFVNLKLESVY